MAVNDMFLDDEGVESNRMRAGYGQDTTVAANREEYTATAYAAPIKIPIYRTYQTINDSRGME